MLESRRDISSSVPYVRRIESKPWKYSWAMDDDVFRGLFVCRKLFSYCKTNDINTSLLRLRGPREFIRQHCHGVSPVETGDVLRHLEIYSAHARYSKHLFETRWFEKTWTRVLRMFSRAREFRIGSWACDGEERPQQPDHDVFPHTHNSSYSKPICRKLQIPVGEAIFRDAAAALRQSAVTISRLDIAHACHSDFEWVHNTYFTALDLSNLQNLFIQPALQNIHDSESYRQQLTQQSRGDVRTAIATVLHKCSSTLQELVILSPEDLSQVGFPAQSNDMPQMPNLEHLAVAGDVRLRALANMIKRSTGLRTLKLYPQNFRETLGRDWRHVWRAIRDHPNNLMVECEVEAMRDGFFTLERYARGEPPRPGDELTARSVIAYISKRGRWDNYCKEEFKEDSDIEPGFERYVESSDESEKSFEEVDDDHDWHEVM